MATAYVLPQVQVFQEFTAATTSALHPLPAHIAGPHAQLVRFNQPDEQPNGLLGFYDNLVNAQFSWPNLTPGAEIDTTYTQLWITNALLMYFQTSIGLGDDVNVLANFNNRITSPVLSFASNGTANPRSGVFFDRDVHPGDIVHVRGIDTGHVSRELWTSVQAVEGTNQPAVVGSATSDIGNATSENEAAAASQIIGPWTGVFATADGSLYNGLISGFLKETYDLVVTEGSINGDYTKAQMRVISGSGTDDQLAITPAAVGNAFSVGTRGLKVTLHHDDLVASSDSAVDAGVPPEALVPGQRFHVTVQQAFTPPTATSGGVYTGTSNTTYIVEVTQGGTWSELPQINITTTNGSDISGPTVVTAPNVAVPVGHFGVTIRFAGSYLRRGDIYYITVTAAAVGPLNVLVLNNNLPATLAAGTELDLTLYILNPALQVSQDRTGFAPLLNWTQTQTTFTVNSGIVAFDPTWTNNGVPMALPVSSQSTKNYGQMFVQYRAWLTDLCNQINLINSVGNLDAAISGALHPDNPLKWGVFMALQNSNGTNVAYTGVCQPELSTSWADVLSLLDGSNQVYGLVPLTKDATVQGLYAADVGDNSTPEIGQWRVAWFNLVDVPMIPLVSAGSTVPGHLAATTSDGNVCLCEIQQDPNAIGTQFTLVICTSGNANFISNGVRAGDIVRTQYTGDGFGNFTFSEYVVASVQSQDQLTLLVGPPAAINVGAKTEVWRNLSATDEATAIGQQAGAWGNRRIRAVWPDQIDGSGFTMDGTFLCCALSGLSSGILPHQGMTNLTLTGFTDVTRTTSKFNRSQLDIMAGDGTWIVTQDQAGNIFSRDALTTAPYSILNERMEMVVRNVDSISYRFLEFFSPYIGVTNVTPVVLARMNTDALSLISVLQTELATPNLGGQLISATIVGINQSPIAADTVIMNLTLLVPHSVDVIQIFLSI